MTGRIFSILYLLVFNILHVSAQLKPMAESAIEMQLRNLAHRFLLASGDSNSYILPLKKINNGYRIEFENPVTFSPDSLAAIAGQLGKHRQLPVPYTLSITTVTSPDIIYGFSSENIQKGQVPATGRRMPADNYVMNIYFPATTKNNVYTTIFLAAMPALGLLIYTVVVRRKRLQQEPPEEKNTHSG